MTGQPPIQVALAVAAAVWLALVTPAIAQDEIVARGNQAYQDGDYAAAVEAYEAVEAAGFQSAGLQYNLGNAYFKSGALGRSILHWERASVLAPGDPDIRANLELARSLTPDAVESLPTFWLFSAASWWVRLFPRGILLTVVALSWLALTGGFGIRILARNEGLERAGNWTACVGGVFVLVLGTNLAIRELGIAAPERAIILVEAVAVRSAPAEDDDLTLFEVREGTRVRIDQRTGGWAEVVLDDGKVGWIPAEVMEAI
jgi:tetratricopeptide (TPR) repeat protein